jgi:hypothetical protein
VVVAEESEIGQRFEIEEVGAGQLEEVAEHLVGVPAIGQYREAVKNITRAAPALANRGVGLLDKDFEALLRPEAADLDAVALRQELLVIGKVKVDQRGACSCAYSAYGVTSFW